MQHGPGRHSAAHAHGQRPHSLAALTLLVLLVWQQPAACSRLLSGNTISTVSSGETRRSGISRSMDSSISGISTTSGTMQIGSSSSRRGAVIMPYMQDELQQLDFEGPLDGDGRLSCMDYLGLRLMAARCWDGPLPMRYKSPAIAVRMCDVPGHGVLVSVHTPCNLGAVFHALLNGPQIMVLPISACAQVQRDEYETSAEPHAHAVHHMLVPADVVPGDYELVLRILWERFSFAPHNPNKTVAGRNDPLWRLPLTMGHAVPPPKDPYAKASQAVQAAPGCTYCDPLPKSWPLCNTPWVRGVVLSRLNTTRKLPRELGLRQGAWQGKVRWQPQGCNFMATSQIDLPKCLKDQVVCFVGDSHMRHLHNGLAAALAVQEGHAPSLSAVTKQSVYDVYDATHSTFHWAQWGDVSQLRTDGVLDNCTQLFVNFGSWPLSQKASPARWTAGHYATAVDNALATVKAMQRRKPQLRAYWVTTPAHSWLLMSERPKEARLPPYMGVFNHVARMLAAKHGIPAINTVDITAPLYETAHDTVHHHYVGLAGATLTQYVANVLCVMGKPAAHVQGQGSQGGSMWQVLDALQG